MCFDKKCVANTQRWSSPHICLPIPFRIIISLWIELIFLFCLLLCRFRHSLFNLLNLSLNFRTIFFSSLVIFSGFDWVALSIHNNIHYLNIDNNSAFVFRARNWFLESFPMRVYFAVYWDSNDSTFSQMLHTSRFSLLYNLDVWMLCKVMRSLVSIALRITNLRLWLLTN